MGWQANIEYFEDYVIKTPKTLEEMKIEITRYLESIGKIEELEKRVKDMQEGWARGLKLVSNSRIPNKMLGYLEFLDNGKIKQRRVLVLESVWNELVAKGKKKEMKKIVDLTLAFIVELWRYGVHETTGKIGYEFGLMGQDIILIDFGELSEKRSTAEKQIAKRYWEKSITKYCSKEVADYFNERAKKVLTKEKLYLNWGKNL